MSNRYKVFTGKTSKDTEERLAEVSLRRRGWQADPYQEKPQPTGRLSEGSAQEFSRFDHSHPTVILEEADPQIPILNEIRFNSANKLVIWDGTQWVPLSVEGAGSVLPRPVGGNRSAGTSTELSRADHTHNIVLEYRTSLTSPTGRQLGLQAYFDTLEHLSLAIYNESQNRWEPPFGRPLLATATSLFPTGKGYLGDTFSELAIKATAGKHGLLYYRRLGSTLWEPVGTVLTHPNSSWGLMGELFRSSPVISPSGQWHLLGTDSDGNVRALPLSVRTYNQSDKPTTSLPVGLNDAYGFFIQDRRLIELYPQQSDGITFPVILTGFQITFPLRPAIFSNTGANTIVETQLQGLPALEFQGSTANTNIPFFITQGVFLPMGIRRVRFLLLLRNPSANNHTFRIRVRLFGWGSTASTTIADITDISVPINASTNIQFVSDPVSITVPATYSSVGGTPCAMAVHRRWDLETTNTNSLVVGIVGLIAVRE